MFSTLLGALPADPERPVASADDPGVDLDAAVALAAIGLELVSDGQEPPGPEADAALVAARWAATADGSSVAVKQVLLGPYSAAQRDGSDARNGRSAEAAEALRAIILALAVAGCPFVEIEEPDALEIAGDPRERATFVDAHRRLLDGTEAIHASLAMTGGNVDDAGPATFFDLAYASYAFDLIAGPDNWRLITQAPMDRGIVCGALDPRPGGDESPELLVWAAHYAASSNGRGLDRVGLANASSLAGLTRNEALRKLRIVAEAARIAAVGSAQEMAGLLDPRAMDRRSVARGRFDPARRRRT
jgi:methionine synthase II (cobalamin-independent)